VNIYIWTEGALGGMRTLSQLMQCCRMVLRCAFVEIPEVWKCALKMNIIWAVRFEVFTAVTMKNGVFWVVTPCGSCKNQRFGGTWRLLH
jgi:hypothetical protein